MDFNDVTFSRLTPEYDIKSFDCGDADLNDFFINSAKIFLKQLLAVTYIIESDDKTIAFFSIFNDKVSSIELTSNNQWNKFKDSLFPPEKSLRSYPAVKIGRLAVHKDYKGSGWGKLIIDYLIDSFINNNKTGCRFITVDAYSASLYFYEKCGFIYMTDKDKDKDTRLMYLDLFPYINT